MWEQYFIAANVDEALHLLAAQKEQARLIAGGTDLVLELERGVRKGVQTLVDISRIPGLDEISVDERGWIHLGPLVTHNQCVASTLLRRAALPLVQACWQMGSPQIRNRGTIAGNLITGSPANDSISPLMALGARLLLRSAAGERQVALADFYTGVRKTVLQPEEMLVDISFPALKESQRGNYIKLALRNAQAISVINAAVILDLQDGVVQDAQITLGAVAPTIVHAREAEEFLTGKRLTGEVMQTAAQLAMQSATPIDDVRSSAEYRHDMVRVTVRRGLESIASGQTIIDLPEKAILLVDPAVPAPQAESGYRQSAPIETTINGKSYTFTTGQHKTLAALLREEAQLTGTKIACGEGECGACTVWLDGKAVMSCLVPAPRAHGAVIATVEGLASPGAVHPLQKAFIEYGAVQCGFCTPGFLMSAAMLLEEKSQPTHADILHGISGNLCRCTGYYKIVEAIEHAAQEINSSEPEKVH